MKTPFTFSAVFPSSRLFFENQAILSVNPNDSVPWTEDVGHSPRFLTNSKGILCFILWRRCPQSPPQQCHPGRSGRHNYIRMSQPSRCVHPPDRMLRLIESSYYIDWILSYPRIYGIWRFWFLQPWTMRCNASSQFGINSLWVFDPIPWTQYGYSPAPCMPMFDLFWKSMYDAMNHWWYDRCYTLWHNTATGLTHTALIHTQSSYYHTSSAYF